MKSIALATMSALLTSPAAQFTVKEIHQDVEELMGKSIAKSTIANYVTYTWVKKGILELAPGSQKGRGSEWIFTPDGLRKLQRLQDRASLRTSSTFRGKDSTKPTKVQSKRTESDLKEQPSVPDLIDSVTLGDAIVNKMDELRDNIRKLKQQITDLNLKFAEDERAWRQQLAGKDVTIREIKGDLERIKKASDAVRRGKTVKLEDVATFSGRSVVG